MGLKPSEVGAKDEAQLERMFDVMRQWRYEDEFRKATDTFSPGRKKAPNEFDNVFGAVSLEIQPKKKGNDNFDDVFN